MERARVEQGTAGERSTPEQREVVRRHGRLLGRTALVSALTLLSRVLGFAREALSALLFGDKSSIYDAFITAWRVPNLFRRLLGEGALATSLQTAITEADHDRGLAAGRRLFLGVMRWATWILLGVCVAIIAAVAWMPDRMPVTGWLWLGNDPAPVRELTIRLMPFVVAVCLAALAGGALQVRGHFASSVWGPCAMNVVWILVLAGVGLAYGWSAAEGELVRERHLGMARALGWGVLAAGAATFAVQIPALRGYGLWPERGEWLGAGAGAQARAGEATAIDVLARALPLAFGAAVYQVNVMVDGLMAEALLAEGGPTTLYYANRIQQMPLGLVAVAATSAVFPALKAFGHTRDFAGVRDLYDRTHLGVCFVALPASAGLFALATPITAVLLQHGAFSAEGVARTAGALRMLALAIIPAGATGLVSRTYFALGDFKTPVRVSIGVLGLNFVLNLALVRGLGMDVAGLTLATAISAWTNVLVLMPKLHRALPPTARELGALARLARMATAALAAGAVAFGAHHLAGGEPRSVIALTVAMAASIAVYLLLAAWMKLPEWAAFSRRFRPGP